MAVHYSDAATELMAARARATWSLFISLQTEFAGLPFPFLAKLRYETREGRGEHLWFDVHGARDGGVDATLTNEPFGDIGMKEGDRRIHDVARLTDWAVLTPAGHINPRDTYVLRTLRAHPELLGELRDHALRSPAT